MFPNHVTRCGDFETSKAFNMIESNPLAQLEPITSPEDITLSEALDAFSG
jgi:hypothetical protein